MLKHRRSDHRAMSREPRDGYRVQEASAQPFPAETLSAPAPDPLRGTLACGERWASPTRPASVRQPDTRRGRRAELSKPALACGRNRALLLDASSDHATWCPLRYKFGSAGVGAGSPHSRLELARSRLALAASGSSTRRPTGTLGQAPTCALVEEQGPCLQPRLRPLPL